MPSPDQRGYQPPEQQDVAPPQDQAEPAKERRVQPIGDFTAHDLRATADAIRARGWGDTNQTPAELPHTVQDGGWEIHSDLEGILFHFWNRPDGEGGVGVTYTGKAEKAPWAYQLAGRKFESVGDAKQWLRQEASRLSAEVRAQKQKDRDQELMNRARNELQQR